MRDPAQEAVERELQDKIKEAVQGRREGQAFVDPVAQFVTFLETAIQFGFIKVRVGKNIRRRL